MGGRRGVLGRGVALTVGVIAMGGVLSSRAHAQTSSPPITSPDRQHIQAGASNSGDSIGANVIAGGDGGDATAMPVRTGGPASRGGGADTGGSMAPPCGGPDNPCEAPVATPHCTVEDPQGPIRLAGIEQRFRIVPCTSPGARPAPPDPAGIARDLARRTPLPLPGVHTSPAPQNDQLVNLPTWMWVDNWSPQTASATEAGLTVTVTALPKSVSWEMGDGSTVVCGPGRAWNPRLREEDQSSDCTHTYTKSSAHQPGLRYRARATMSWDVRWTATNGESGALGTASRTTEFTMRVAEGQALVTTDY